MFPAFSGIRLCLFFFCEKKFTGIHAPKTVSARPVFGACILGECPACGAEGKALKQRNTEKSFSCLVTKIPSRVFQCKQTSQQKILQQKASAARERRSPRRSRADGVRKNKVITRNNLLIIPKSQTLDFALFFKVRWGYGSELILAELLWRRSRE